MQRLSVAVAFNSDHETACGGDGDTSNRSGAEVVADALGKAGVRARLLGLPDCEPAALSRLTALRSRVVFNLVESLSRDTREHPRFPDALDRIGVPYTGPDGATLRTCLFKDRAKQALLRAGIRTPESLILRSGDELPEDSPILPGIVKLLHEDASIGMTTKNVATSAKELRERAREMIREFQQPVIVERFIAGREVNVSVLGTGATATTLPLFEIDFTAMPEGSPHIVSFAAKWDEQHPDYRGTQPTRLRAASPSVRAAITQAALATYEVLRIRDYGRIDLRIDEQGVPWVIDVNPNCDVSPDAGFVRAAKAAGLGYPELLRTICELAFERASSSVQPRAAERAASTLGAR